MFFHNSTNIRDYMKIMRGGLKRVVKRFSRRRKLTGMKIHVCVMTLSAVIFCLPSVRH